MAQWNAASLAAVTIAALTGGAAPDAGGNTRVAFFGFELINTSLVHPSGIEGLIFGSWGYAIRREASLRRSSGRAWPWWR
jgi:hypothetical protein